MQNILQYINLSWAVVGICEGPHLPLSALVHEENDMEETVEHYVIGYITDHPPVETLPHFKSHPLRRLFISQIFVVFVLKWS